MRFLLALVLVVVLASVADAGPVRNWIAQRREAKYQDAVQQAVGFPVTPHACTNCTTCNPCTCAGGGSFCGNGKCPVQFHAIAPKCTNGVCPVPKK